LYRNLEAEMVRNGITRKDVSDLLNVRYATVVQKLNGKYKFNLEEAFVIKDNYFPGLSLEYLFQADEKPKPKVKMRN
jgi:DNA-binding XRE family transcriptional regulator